MNPTGELEKKALDGTFLQRLAGKMRYYFHNHTQTEVTQEETKLTHYDRIRLRKMKQRLDARRARYNIHNSSEVVPKSYSGSD